MERSHNTEVKLPKDLEDQDSEKSKRKGKGSLGIALRKQNKTKTNKQKISKPKAYTQNITGIITLPVGATLV